MHAMFCGRCFVAAMFCARCFVGQLDSDFTLTRLHIPVTGGKARLHISHQSLKLAYLEPHQIGFGSPGHAEAIHRAFFRASGTPSALTTTLSLRLCVKLKVIMVHV